jgi:hypothetical protein
MTIETDGSVQNLCLRSSEIDADGAIQCMFATLRGLRMAGAMPLTYFCH